MSLSAGFTRAKNLDCGRAWLWKAFHRSCRRNPDCVRGTAKGYTRVRGEFDRVKLQKLNGLSRIAIGDSPKIVLTLWSGGCQSRARVKSVMRLLSLFPQG